MSPAHAKNFNGENTVDPPPWTLSRFCLLPSDHVGCSSVSHVGLSSTSSAGCSISLTSFLSVLACSLVVSAHLPALKTMVPMISKFFFPSCVFSLDLYSHRHSITVLHVQQQPSKMFYFRLIHWHEFDLISAFKVVYPLSGWIRHMWLSWFSFSALFPAVLCLCSFQMKSRSSHSSFSQTTSNPSAKSSGFYFQTYLHFHHFSIHCSQHPIETILISSDLPELTLQVSLLPLISMMLSIHYYKLSNNMKHPYYDVHCANQRIRALALT